MSLPLPVMNNLCRRWVLPEHIRQNCDLYFLRNLPDTEFAELVQPRDTHLVIREHGIDFEVVFIHEAKKVYERLGGNKKREEANLTHYWCSFRSLTFNWNGKECVKSFVLVAVDRGQKKEKKSRSDGAKPLSAPKNFQDLHKLQNKKMSVEEFNHEYLCAPQEKPQAGIFRNFKTFIEKSVKTEKEED